MSDAYFTPTVDGLQPRDHAHGPWSPAMLHGRLLGGLAARALERDHGEAGLQPCRLTVDLFKSVGLEPVAVSTVRVRDGRRIRVADAEVRVGGVVAGRASAVFLRSGEDQSGVVWQPERWAAPDPDDVARTPSRDPSTWELRVVDGGLGTGQRTRVWTADRAPLVDDEVASPFVRAASSADLASPLSNGADDGLHYINADYTLALARLPVGEWIGLEVAQHLAGPGVAVGSCTLYDRGGAFATSTATALANPVLEPQR